MIINDIGRQRYKSHMGYRRGMRGADDNLGDLGWGWKSITNVAKKVGSGAVSVAKMPVGVARRVAAASASVLCDKDGNPRNTDATSVNYCKA